MPTNTEPRAAAELARSLDCLTEQDLCALGNITRNTAEAWRKRGTGPDYILFGRTFLYPREPLAKFLNGRVRGRIRGVSEGEL